VCDCVCVCLCVGRFERHRRDTGDLIGTIKEFFERVGVTKIKFKPAYNPYTEPSMEVFAYHEVLVRRRHAIVRAQLVLCSTSGWKSATGACARVQQPTRALTALSQRHVQT
jgi:hypothetical protein